MSLFDLVRLKDEAPGRISDSFIQAEEWKAQPARPLLAPRPEPFPLFRTSLVCQALLAYSVNKPSWYLL